MINTTMLGDSFPGLCSVFIKPHHLIIGVHFHITYILQILHVVPVVWKYWVVGSCASVYLVTAHRYTEMSDIDRVCATEVCT